MLYCNFEGRRWAQTRHLWAAAPTAKKAPEIDVRAIAMWLAVACMLAALRIEKPVDESGAVIEPTLEFTSGLVR